MRRLLLFCFAAIAAGSCGLNRSGPRATSATPTANSVPSPAPAPPSQGDFARSAHLPLFPGATVLRSHDQKGDGRILVDAVLETKDDPQKVIDFYKRQGLVGSATSQAGRCMGKTKEGTQAIVEAQRKGDSTSVTIRTSVPSQR